MIVKIVASLRYNQDGAEFDTMFFDVDVVNIDRSFFLKPNTLVNYDIIAQGANFIYGKDEPRRTKEPETYVHLGEGEARKTVCVRGACDIYIMNEQGKTIDHYPNR